jgi:uncharacterized protein (TIGR02444 family)
MKEGSATTTEGLWDFAVRLYGRPGVAQACLGLQEAVGANVPILLLAAWLGRQSKILDAGMIASVGADMSPWHDQVVSPLRQLRRLLKVAPHPAPSPSTDALRERIKTCELEAERIEIAQLESRRWTALPRVDDPRTAVWRNLTGAVDYYRAEAPNAALQGLIATIADAASRP